MHRSSNETLIVALRVLARDVQSEDGVANSCLSEAADRMEELNTAALAVLEWNYHVGDRVDVAESIIDLRKAVGVTEEWLCRK